MKKRAVVALLGCLVSGLLYGQQFAVVPVKMNIAYLGVDNPLMIVVPDAGCNNLLVTTDNGTIAKDDKCNYSFRPGKTGQANITIKIKTSGTVREIGSSTMRIKALPAPVATFANHTGGTMPAVAVRVQKGIMARLDGFDWPTTFEVSSFRFTIKRNGASVYTAANSGAVFQREVAEQLYKALSGDKVLITEISAKGPDGRQQHLNNIEITLQ